MRDKRLILCANSDKRDSEEDDLVDRLLDPQGYDRKVDDYPVDETDVQVPPEETPDVQPSDVDPPDVSRLGIAPARAGNLF